MPENETPSFVRSLGEFFGLLSGNLGRALAVFGGLWVGFACINKATSLYPPPNDWVYLTIAAAVFLGLTMLCCKRTK